MIMVIVIDNNIKTTVFYREITKAKGKEMKGSVFWIFLSVSVSVFAEELLDEARMYFAPLPKQFQSKDNPLTEEKVKLGKILFYERRISKDGNISCATCHPIEYYGTYKVHSSEDESCLDEKRDIPTVLNAAGQRLFGWIGMGSSIEEHAKKAIVGKIAFKEPSYRWLESRLKGIEGYRKLFSEAFPEDKNPININNVAKAIGAFERTLTTPSRFDRYLRGEIDALTSVEKKGLKLFIDKGCVSCHIGMFVGGNIYRKFGVIEQYWMYTNSTYVDYGRYLKTSNPDDKYVFKVPSLRNVEKTAPYFHDGSVKELKEAIRIMGKVQLGIELSVDEINAIEAFLKSLTGEIPPQARELPVMP